MVRRRRVIPWWQPVFGALEQRAVERVLKSGYINEGPQTEKFEAAVAALLGVQHAVATTSGTAALFLALKALGVGPGHEVIVPDVTFVATANAVLLTGAKPVLVDVGTTTLSIDVEQAKKATTAATRAIIPVHLSGRQANIVEVLQLGIPVVEDAAQAFMSGYHDKYLGTWGAAGCFSFSPNKLITTGQGGMLVTNNAKLAKFAREFKNQGHPLEFPRKDDVQLRMGANFKFTDLQAAVGLAQLKRLDGRIERLHRNRRLYINRLGDRMHWYQYNGLPLWNDFRSRTRTDAFLAQHGIEARTMYQPLHFKPQFRGEAGEFPNATQLAEKTFWLPSAFTLTDAEVEHICDVVEEVA